MYSLPEYSFHLQFVFNNHYSQNLHMQPTGTHKLQDFGNEVISQ